jgi:hypothetical protein
VKDESFVAVRAVGGILPADLFSKVLAGSEIPGLEPGDYHLASGETVREAANRAWSYLSGVWGSFNAGLDGLPAGDTATSLTREKWLLVLFRELGFGRLQGTPAGGIVADGRKFAISHEWASVPIHLLGWGVELDRRTPGLAGAAAASPQSLVQECLNRSDDHLWGIASNGRVLRMLRDSTALVGSSYVEFDLEAIFDGDVFSEFVLLYLLCHESRFEALTEGNSTDCWLERWRNLAIEQGTRALNQLRDGVADAIGSLGTGFLSHTANAELRSRLERGDLHLEDFHRALLRLVYRLLFLFVAEDRRALLHPDATPTAVERYTRFFSSAGLRRVARRRRGSRHGDRWRSLTIVFDGLGGEQGLPELGLPALGGIFEPGESDVLSGSELANSALLAAIRSLSIVRDRAGGPGRTIDYRNLGAEELGSVYESLLEMLPRHDPHTNTFSLEKAAGNERKTTGSYYTPSSLIDALLDTTLDPLLAEAENSDDPAAALLDLTVCDPACGSGHFLVAAARRIAKRLAIIETGDPEPAPDALQSAMRRVVSSCIYGVDVNPLAAELAKVSLWLEALEPGRPLSFLDAQIKVGNSLLGTTPALLAAGIPDEAFKPIEGDDKKVAGVIMRRNRTERSGQGDLFAEAGIRIANTALGSSAREVIGVRAKSLTDVHVQAKRFRDYDSSPELARAREVADAWCAAFLWRKSDGAPEAVTQGTLRLLDANPDAVSAGTPAEIARLAAQFRFFHWHLEFPHVFRVAEAGSSDVDARTGWSGGFSCVIGNPPWERIKVQEREFFGSRNPGIASAPNAAARRRKIAALLDSDSGRFLHTEFLEAKRIAESNSHFLRNSGRYPLTGRGDVNTYAVFSELMLMLVGARGRVGAILPTGILTDDTTKLFFQSASRQRALVAVMGFINEKLLFPSVLHNFKFCILVLCGRERRQEFADLVFYCQDTADLGIWDRHFSMSYEDIVLVNPNTGTCPVFSSDRAARIVKAVYSRLPILEERSGSNPWGLMMSTMFHMSGDSELFVTTPQPGYVPLYEAKMIHQFNHRYASYEHLAEGKRSHMLPEVPVERLSDASYEVSPCYHVPEVEVDHRLASYDRREWLMVFREITSAGLARTSTFSIVPKVGVNHKLPLVWTSPEQADLAPVLLACMNSFVLDFCLRQKLGGASISFYVIRQLPVPEPDLFRHNAPWDEVQLGDWIGERVLELVYTSWSVRQFALHNGATGPPFLWDVGRRERLRAELDAAFFQIYGLVRDEAEFVLDSFTVFRDNEERRHGHYRTKHQILDVFDSMTAAVQSGEIYQTILDPPAGQGPGHPDSQGGHA